MTLQVSLFQNLFIVAQESCSRVVLIKSASLITLTNVLAKCQMLILLNQAPERIIGSKGNDKTDI